MQPNAVGLPGLVKKAAIRRRSPTATSPSRRSRVRSAQDNTAIQTAAGHASCDIWASGTQLMPLGASMPGRTQPPERTCVAIAKFADARRREWCSCDSRPYAKRNSQVSAQLT